MRKKNPAKLPGKYDTRVFVGGSYLAKTRQDLTALEQSISQAGFDPIVADYYDYGAIQDLHDITLFLLHMCKYAIFEMTLPSGALMEVERLPDYGTRSLILYSNPKSTSHLPSQMLSSFVLKHKSYITVHGYLTPASARHFAVQWLGQQKGTP